MAMIMFGATMFLSSCDDEEENAKKVTIKNNSTYTLERFRIIFLNARDETLVDKDFGTLAPGESISIEIPAAATEYYMATYLSNIWFFSPNYTITYTSLKLSTSEVNNWGRNSINRLFSEVVEQ